MRVWDPIVRITHWGLAALVIVDLFNEAGANAWHRGFGYAAAGLILARVLWGLFGSPHARLSAMARTAAQVGAYMRRSHEAARSYLAHNPLGAWMAFTLWSLTLFVIVTGWMLQLEPFWGDERLQGLHLGSAYALGGLIVVHVLGAVVTGAQRRVNLVKAMITGSKRISD